jgi:hypothetical protein
MLINREKGFASCSTGDPESYDVTYKTKYIIPRISLEFKYFGIDLGIGGLSQERGWCENILHGKSHLFYGIRAGLLEKIYFSFGKSENFRLSKYDEILAYGLFFNFDKSLSDIGLRLVGTPSNWGYELIIKKLVYSRFLVLASGSYNDRIRAFSVGSNPYHSKVHYFNIGFGYIFHVKN